MSQIAKMVYHIPTSCKVVKGYTRGIIYDLDRSNYNLVPLELIDFLHSINGKTESEIQTSLLLSSNQEYLAYIVEKEYVLMIPEHLTDSFPDISEDYEIPGSVQTAIFILSKEISFSLDQYLKELVLNGCKSAVFCVEIEFTKDQWNEITRSIQNSDLLEIQFICNYISRENNEILLELHQLPIFVSNIIIYNALEQKLINITDINSGAIIPIGFYTLQPFSFDSLNVDIDYFNVHVPTYIESIEYNIFFNKKIFISSEGLFSHDYLFEKILGSELQYLKSLKEFVNEYSLNSKMKNAVCSTCEFRNMCNDPRIPILEKSGLYSFKRECNYNPFICKWAGEEGYQNLEDSGVTLNGTKLNVDKEALENNLHLLYRN